MECSSVDPCDQQRFSGVHTQGMSLETLLESSGSLWTMQRKKETLMMIYAIFRNVCKNKHHYYDAFCLYFSKQ